MAEGTQHFRWIPQRIIVFIFRAVCTGNRFHFARFICYNDLVYFIQLQNRCDKNDTSCEPIVKDEIGQNAMEYGSTDLIDL